MTSDALRALPSPAETAPDCACAGLRAPGWESVSQPLGEPLLRRIGTLRDAAAAESAEPSVEEWPGSHLWSPESPIAPGYFPYNRCDVWACRTCGRGFLQYTEYGGYYVAFCGAGRTDFFDADVPLSSFAASSEWRQLPCAGAVG